MPRRGIEVGLGKLGGRIKKKIWGGLAQKKVKIEEKKLTPGKKAEKAKGSRRRGKKKKS